VIDTDANSAKLLAVVLERAGCLVVVTHSVEAAKRLLDLLRFHIMVLEPGTLRDIGLDHAHALQRHTRGETPLVIVSSSADWADVRCAGYFQKPIDVAKFATNLLSILEGTP